MYDAYVAVSNGTIYCTGTTPNKDNQHDVYSYDMRSDQWKQLPRPGHRIGVIHMVDNKLTIFGGRDSITNNITNKVTTYNSKTNSWYSLYPNMIYNRSKLGVITFHNHVIVMGGGNNPDIILDSIEVMNYHCHLQWREISVHLPIPMWGIKPTISGDNISIVGHSDAGGHGLNYYETKIEDMISSFDQPLPIGVESTPWKKLSAAPYCNTVTIPYSNPPVIIGGRDINDVCTSDVMLYDSSKNTWMKVDSLTSARSGVGVALLNNTTTIVIGGTTSGAGVAAAMESSLTTVEIGTIVPNL